MRTIQLGLLGSIALFIAACASDPTPESSTATPLQVAFLDTTPVIDGRLDPGLESMTANRFAEFYRFDNPELPRVEVTYRLGYTAHHLYLYLETDAPEVSYHARGYLWGDGYKLLLGLPQPDGRTDEYYELTYSPTEDLDDSARQRIAVYNAGQETDATLSEGSRSRAAAGQRHSGFEALIAWDDIPPYHPWFVDRLGLNLYFAKGFDTADHGYFPNGYAVVHDEGIWDEEVLRRAYVELVFQPPSSPAGDSVLAYANEGHVVPGLPLTVDVLRLSDDKEALAARITVSDAAGRVVDSRPARLEPSDGLAPQRIVFGKINAVPGIYAWTIEVDGHRIRRPLGLLPAIDASATRASIEANPSQLSNTTVETLLFKLQSLERALEDLKLYESGDKVLETWRDLETDLELFREGRAPYDALRTNHRRSFRSRQDGTLQPYSIRLPEGFDEERSYPLVVILHGSGQDEQTILDLQWTGHDLILLAPFGRDRYRAYAERDSQRDIVEAIERVRQDFRIDADAIILGGFSMGGYGALRTYYERPELYRAVFVFAGHPNLASEWLDAPHPNFLESDYAEAFTDTPVFVYHGAKDAALDVALMQRTAALFQQLGAEVSLHIDPERGHQFPDEQVMQAFQQWLQSVIDRKPNPPSKPLQSAEIRRSIHIPGSTGTAEAIPISEPSSGR